MSTIFNVTWTHLQILVEHLASKIQWGGAKYDCIIGIPRGGLIPAVMLSHILNLRVMPSYAIEEDDFLCNNKALIVDDIADSGGTLKKFSKYLDTATIYCKIGLEDKPTYYAKEALQDEWIMFPYERCIDDPISVANYKDYHNETRDDISA